MTDFTVSPPDLNGFAGQIGSIGEFYASVGEQAATRSFELSAVSPVGAPFLTVQLTGTLVLFIDDFVALVHAQRDAAARLAGGLPGTSQALAEVARAYQLQDEDAKQRIQESGSSEEDQAVDDAIEEGEPNFDWQSRLSADDYFGDISFELPEMTYEGKFEEFNMAFAALGNLPVTIDALIQSLFGVSILKSLTVPLLGGWGFLGVMRDICAAEATAFETASTALDNGVNTLVGDNWTGDAANAFAGHIEATRTPIDAQVANLRAASTMFGTMRDTLDTAGNDIGALLGELLNLALSVFVEALNVTRYGLDKVMDLIGIIGSGAQQGYAALNSSDSLAAMIKSALGPLLSKIVMAVEGLVRAIVAASTSTQSLCNELNALEPPALRSGETGGMSPADPEGLTEEPNPEGPEGLTEEPNEPEEPEGLTEEPNEPEGLTEEPNDGAESDEVLAGSQQSQR